MIELAGILLKLRCRNCQTDYDWNPPYATFISPPADYDPNAENPLEAGRYPKCPRCESWAAQVRGQIGTTA